jgi:molecular chaperone GrpE (heat shock protein)
MRFKVFTEQEASLCPDLQNEMSQLQIRYERLAARWEVLRERIR